MPDKDHPVTKGFACHKGLAVLDIHNDPDRLRWPLQKNGKTFERVSWATADATVGERLRALQARHGKNAIGIYSGNPLALTQRQGLQSAHLSARSAVAEISVPAPRIVRTSLPPLKRSLAPVRSIRFRTFQRPIYCSYWARTLGFHT